MKATDEMMKKINALVTGVGAIIGYGAIKSLRSSNLRVNIVGMDIYPDAVGQRWCDKFIQAKPAADAGYINFLKSVMDENEIDIVFFGTEQEIYAVDAFRTQLEGYLPKIVVNRSEILKLSKDKWATREFLLQNGLGSYAIPSVIEGSYDEIAACFGEKFLLKPRSSYASKGIEKVENAEEFDFYKKRMGKNFMAQRLVGDVEHEYTVAVFGLGDGTYSGLIALKRKLSQEGATAKAEVVDDPALTAAVEKMCKALCPIGPTNFQFRLHEGQYLLLEVNPRISSSTSIRMAFGYNEAELCVRYFVQGEQMQPVLRKGKAIRYIDEVVTLQ